MKISSFNTLLENMPDSINVSGIEKLGFLHFDSEIDFEAGDYQILITIQGFQQMDIVSGTFEINKDNLFVFNSFGDLKVLHVSQYLKLFPAQQNRLLKTIIKLINLEL